MDWNYIPKSLASNEVATFDFQGDVTGNITDQTGTYTLTHANTPREWTNAMIGDGVAYDQTSSEYHYTTNATIRRSGSAFTWAMGVFHGNNFAVDSNIYVAPIRLLQTAGSLGGNDLRAGATRTSGGSNQWFVQGQGAIDTEPLIENFTQPKMMFLTSNGSTDATLTIIDWATGSTQYTLSYSNIIASIGEVRFGQISTSSTYNGSLTRIDHAVLYNKVLSGTEMGYHWEHNWRLVQEFRRGYALGKASA